MTKSSLPLPALFLPCHTSAWGQFYFGNSLQKLLIFLTSHRISHRFTTLLILELMGKENKYFRSFSSSHYVSCWERNKKDILELTLSVRFLGDLWLTVCQDIPFKVKEKDFGICLACICFCIIFTETQHSMGLFGFWR